MAWAGCMRWRAVMVMACDDDEAAVLGCVGLGVAEYC